MIYETCSTEILNKYWAIRKTLGNRLVTTIQGIHVQLQKTKLETSRQQYRLFSAIQSKIQRNEF